MKRINQTLKHLWLVLALAAGTALADTPVLDIYLARHGQTDWNLEKRLQGGTDNLLNETGRQQAKQLGDKLAGVPIMSHQAFLALGLLEHALAGMYPMQLWRASGEAVSYGHVHAVFRQMLRLGNIAPTGEKNPRGRPIYVITEAGRAALVTMRALIVEV